MAVRNRPYPVVRTRRSMSAALTQCFSTRTESLAQLILAARVGHGKSAWSTRRAERPKPDGLRPPGRRDLHVACQGRVRSTPPRYSPSGATAAKPTQARIPSQPWPGSPRAPKSPASTVLRTSAGPATSDSAPRSPRSPATAATPAPGLRRSITTPAPPAKTTRRPSGSWPAPGSGSPGLAGSTASPTTPPRSPNNRLKANCGLRLA